MHDHLDDCRPASHQLDVPPDLVHHRRALGRRKLHEQPATRGRGTDEWPAAGVVMSTPEHTVECVAERRGAVTLFYLAPDGVRLWRTVPVRPVPAYQAAAFGTCALAVSMVALLIRPMVVGWPWWLHAVFGLLVTVGAWLLVAMLTGLLWVRLVESLVTDAVETVLRTSPELGPEPEGGEPDEARPRS